MAYAVAVFGGGWSRGTVMARRQAPLLGLMNGFVMALCGAQSPSQT